MSATVISPNSVAIVVNPAPARDVVVTPRQVVTVANLGIKGDQGPQGIPGTDVNSKSFSVAMAIALG